MADKKLGITIDVKGADKAAKDIQGVGNSAGSLAKLSSVGNVITGLNQAFSMLTTVFNYAMQAFNMGKAVVQDVVNEFSEAEQAAFKMQTVMKGMGQYTTSSAKDLQEYSTKLQNKTGIEDESVQSVMSMLMVHKQFGEGLKNATKTALDLAELLGGDYAGAANLLGKALENPIENVDMLRRSGVMLNKEVFEGLTLEQQRAKLLEEVNKKVGGQSEKLGTLAGQQRLFNATIGDLKEQLGAALSPAYMAFFEGLNKALQGLDLSAIGPAVAQSVATLGKALADLSVSLLTNENNTKALILVITNLATVVTKTAEAITFLSEANKKYNIQLYDENDATQKNIDAYDEQLLVMQGLGQVQLDAAKYSEIFLNAVANASQGAVTHTQEVTVELDNVRLHAQNVVTSASELGPAFQSFSSSAGNACAFTVEWLNRVGEAARNAQQEIALVSDAGGSENLGSESWGGKQKGRGTGAGTSKGGGGESTGGGSPGGAAVQKALERWKEITALLELYTKQLSTLPEKSQAYLETEKKIAETKATLLAEIEKEIQATEKSRSNAGVSFEEWLRIKNIREKDIKNEAQRAILRSQWSTENNQFLLEEQERVSILTGLYSKKNEIQQMGMEKPRQAFEQSIARQEGEIALLGEDDIELQNELLLDMQTQLQDGYNQGLISYQEFSDKMNEVTRKRVENDKKLEKKALDYRMKGFQATMEWTQSSGELLLASMQRDKMRQGEVVKQAGLKVIDMLIPQALAQTWTRMGGFPSAIPAVAIMGSIMYALRSMLAGIGAAAEGGIFTKPTLTWVGERGPEMIVPFDRLPQANTMPGASPLPTSKTFSIDFKPTINIQNGFNNTGELVRDALRNYSEEFRYELAKAIK